MTQEYDSKYAINSQATATLALERGTPKGGAEQGRNIPGQETDGVIVPPVPALIGYQ